MNKFLSLLLAAMLLTVAFLPAAANPPEPASYAVIAKGPCWLPNGETKPTKSPVTSQTFHWVAPLQLVATCRGQLPKDTPWPKETIKLTFQETGLACEIVYGSTIVWTTDYGAVVYPDGATEITCRGSLE